MAEQLSSDELVKAVARVSITSGALLSLLHLCDSLFPIGGFAYSDGLEAAAAGRDGILPAAAAASLLRACLYTCLGDTIGRLEGPIAWESWTAVHQRELQTLSLLCGVGFA